MAEKGQRKPWLVLQLLWGSLPWTRRKCEQTWDALCLGCPLSAPRVSLPLSNQEGTPQKWAPEVHTNYGGTVQASSVLSALIHALPPFLLFLLPPLLLLSSLFTFSYTLCSLPRPYSLLPFKKRPTKEGLFCSRPTISPMIKSWLPHTVSHSCSFSFSRE